MIVWLAMMAAALATVHDAQAGTRLSRVQIVPDSDVTPLDLASGIALSTPDGAFLYVAAPGEEDAVTAFARDQASGHVTVVNAVSGIGLVAPSIVAVSSDGAQVYVATKDSIVTLARDGLSGAVSFVGGAPYGAHALALAVSPDGGNVYVGGDRLDGNLSVYARNPSTGELTLVQELEAASIGGIGLDETTGVVVSPDGLHVYATGSEDDAVVVFDRDPGTGELTLLHLYVDGSPAGSGTITGLHRPETMVMSPDGYFLYVSAGGGMATFIRDPGTGLLDFVEWTYLSMRLVELRMTPDQTRLIGRTRSGEPDLLVLFNRDLGGALSLAAFADVEDNGGVAISPDGRFVYGTSRTDDLLVALRVIGDGACSPAPLSGCAQPSATGSLLVLTGGIDPHPRFTWKWTDGGAIALTDFGQPATELDDVVVCLYDGGATPVTESVIPGGALCGSRSCWKQRPTTLKYKERLYVPPPILAPIISPAAARVGFDVKAGVPGIARLKVRLKGPGMAPTALPLALPAVVQVQAATGSCWEAVFSVPQRNDDSQFKAKSD
jgi:6-phosphogluconolactonase (cycloisomerase 2 family)